MEIHGNATTFNVESVLLANIKSSDYYRNTCLALTTVSEVIDEIYDNVNHVEPWMSGNARGPSTAFCTMFRLFTLKMTEDDMHTMLTHKDSPYIRAVGFLYLRYVGDPKSLWAWYGPYARDHEEFQPSPDGRSVTIGDFVRDIVLDQYYFETIFPRIPKKAQDDMIEELRRMGLPTVAKGNAGAGGGDRRGVEDGGKRPASVKASLSVSMGQRAPNRAAAREEGRGKDPSLQLRTADQASARDDPRRPTPPPGGAAAGRSRDRSRERPYERDRERGGGGGGYERDRDRGGYDKERDRRRDVDDRRGGGGAARSSGRDSYGGSGRDGGGRDGYGGANGRDSSRDGRGYERGGVSGRDSERDRGRDARDGGRDARDVFRDGARDARDVFRDSASDARRVLPADELRSRYG